MTMLLGLDIGTTTIKCVVYDPQQGRVMNTAARPTPVYHPRAGWSEHDPQTLWETTAECIQAAASSYPVSGLAISSMAEAGVLVDRDSRPLYPIIAWYDRRSEPQAAWIEKQISVADLYRITGQRVSPSFAATKILWLLENSPEIKAQAARWMPVPCYLLWRLTGLSAVDFSIASRTLLFDQRSLNWSQDLMERFRLPGSLLPPVHSGGTPVGTVTAQAAKETGLSESTVCALGGHDHLCATLAGGAHQAGSLTDSTGSANALLLLLPEFHPDPALAER